MGSNKSVEEYENEIKALVDSNAVVVLSKTYCPYCVKAKAILKSVVPNDKMVIIELDTDANGTEKQKAGQNIHGQRTVPQIWIGKKFIGGCSDLEALKNKGTLKALVDKAVA